MKNEILRKMKIEIFTFTSSYHNFKDIITVYLLFPEILPATSNHDVNCFSNLSDSLERTYISTLR